jgi:hypothetical protein
MPRPQLRLGTIGLFVVIVALTSALFFQRQRESALRAELARVQGQLASTQQDWAQERANRAAAEAHQKIAEYRALGREEELATARAQGEARPGEGPSP